MPTFDFDVTDEANQYALDEMQTMVDNEGQQALLEALNIDSYCIVSVHIAGDNVDTKVNYDVTFNSSHPDAIEDMLSHGEQAFQEFSERASDILALVDLAWSELA